MSIRLTCAVLVVAIGVAGAGGAMMGQQASQPPQSTSSVFRSGVDVIAVDVMVVDRDGRPVKGLAPEQFTVTLNGKPRRVVTAEFVDVVPPPAKPAAPVSPTWRFFTSNLDALGRPLAPSRLIYLAVDQASFRMSGAAAAREAARTFIDKLAPTDRIGLVTFPGPGPFVVASADHTTARDAAERIVGLAEPPSTLPSGGRLGLAEAVDIKAGDDRVYEEVVKRECADFSGQARAACAEAVMSEAIGQTLQAANRATRSLNGLESLVRGLSQVRERKIVVLLSAGLPFADRPGPELQIGPEIGSIAREAAAANVTLFALHLDSSVLSAVGATESRRTTGGDSLWRDAGMLRSGLDMLASASGGSLEPVIAHSEAAFDRVLRETAASYLLGVEPAPGDRDGKSRRITVSVKAQGVLVRSRSEVTMPGPDAKPASGEDGVAARLREQRAATELPVSVTALTTAQESEEGLVVVFSADIGQRVTESIDVQVGYSIVDSNGRASAVTSENTRLLRRPTSRIGAASYVANGILKPGKYVLRLAAIDAEGRAGSVDHPFTVGLDESDDLRIGSLLVIDPSRRKEGSIAIASDGGVTGDSVDLQVDALPKPGHPVPVTVTIGLTDRAGGALLVGHRSAASRKHPDGPVTAGVHLDVGMLPFGDYLAVAEFYDGERRLARVERPIRLER
jgi:VWFA-related protein